MDYPKKGLRAIIDKKRLALIHYIDSCVLERNANLPEVFRNTVLTLSEIYNASCCSGFFRIEKEIFMFYGELSPGAAVAMSHYSPTNNSDTYEVTAFNASIIGCIKGIPSVFLILDGIDDASDFDAFLRAVLQQLSVYYTYVHTSLELNSQVHIARAFFNVNLLASSCWAEVVDTYDKFIPAWADLPDASLASTQLLTFDANERTLRVVASNRMRGVGKLLRASDSAVGIITTLPEDAPYVYIDPTEHLGIYKRFLPSDSRSELMIPLRQTGVIIGVLNIEHPAKAAFSKLYINYALLLSRVLEPYISGLIARYTAYKQKELELLYIFGKTLRGVGTSYGHLIEQSLSKIQASNSEISKHCKAKQDFHISPYTEEIKSAVRQARTEAQYFLSSFPIYLEYKSLDIEDVIKNRLKGLRGLAAGDKIEIIYTQQCPLLVYGTLFIQEHVYNIVYNSIQAIQGLLVAQAIHQGIVLIEVTRRIDADDAGARTGICFVDIRVSDNGGGAPEPFLSRIGTLGCSQKEGGSGIGLSAARSYFETIGGTVTWRNSKMEDARGFEVTCSAQEYDHKRHVTGGPAQLIRRSIDYGKAARINR